MTNFHQSPLDNKKSRGQFFLHDCFWITRTRAFIWLNVYLLCMVRCWGKHRFPWNLMKNEAFSLVIAWFKKNARPTFLLPYVFWLTRARDFIWHKVDLFCMVRSIWPFSGEADPTLSLAVMSKKVLRSHLLMIGRSENLLNESCVLWT